jgi:hypothetical protein
VRVLFGIAAAAVLAWLALAAWGFVHSRQHAYAHVQLAGTILASPGARLEFLDAKGTTIGRAIPHRGLWRVAHPDVAIGACTAQERRGGEAWNACNDALSRETARWIGAVHAARLRDEGCLHPAVPVMVRVDRPDIFGWWNPLQHGAGLPAPWVSLAVPPEVAACAGGAAP